MKKNYRDIQGYEGKYMISDDGDVYSVRSQRTLKTFPNKNYGFHQVMLWNNGSIKLHYLHRLVAQAFVENPNGYKVVTHVNRDKNDNRAENLKWVEKAVRTQTPKEEVPEQDGKGIRLQLSKK